MIIDQPLPLSTSLNVIVQHMAQKLFPTGYDTSPDAPDSLESLNDQIAQRGRLVVYSGASDNTIFGAPEINHDFRAWHDWTHWRHQLPFTPEGEQQVAELQIGHMVQLCMFNDFDLNSALIDIEINDQVDAFEQTGAFPTDQRQFALDRLEARGLVHLLR